MTTCVETYSTLRIMSDSVAPEKIGDQLGIEPTQTIPIDPTSRYRTRRQTHYWSWSTKDKIEGVENLEHIKAIVGLLKGKESILNNLREEGCEIDVVNYWVSIGQGGPELDVDTMKELYELGLPIWWDVYFERDTAEKSLG